MVGLGLVPLVTLVGGAGAQPEACYADGYHGGYFLAGKSTNRQALEDLFQTLDRYPEWVAVLEFEPYTLERMLHGAKYPCEMPPDTPAQPVGWVGGVSQCEGGVGYEESAGRGHVVGLRMRNGTGPGSYANLCQTANAIPWRGKTLVLSGAIRADTPGADLYIDAHDGARVVGASASARPTEPNGEWQRVECRFAVDPRALVLYPQAKVMGVGEGQEGVAWFDDLSLRDEQSGTELLTNGDFEQAEDADLRMADALARLREYVAGGRIEMVGGTYTQPLCYPQEGESVVRQFVLGLEATREALGVDIVTYAAQEPCFASQFPQMLTSLGFTGCLFRNSWAPFGNPPPRDAQQLLWEGPDGSRLAAVPRYALDPMVGFGFPAFPTRELIAAAARVPIALPMWHQFADFLPEWTPAVDPEALLSGRAFAWANFCRAVPGQDLVGRTVTLSARAKAETTGAHLYIDAHGPQGYLGASARSRDVLPDGTWQSLEITFTVPEGAVRLFPQAKVEGTAAAAWVADLRLVGPDGTVPADAAADGPEMWDAGNSPGAEVTCERLATGGPDGEPCVRLTVAGQKQRVAPTTLSGYMRATPPPEVTWADPYDGFQQRYPWGILGGEVQRVCRRTEEQLQLAERLAAIAGLEADERLGDAWRLLFMAQHHDTWVCAPVRFGVWRGPEQSYAELCAAWCRQAEELTQQVREEARARLLGPAREGVTVVNPSGRARVSLVEVALPEGAAVPDGPGLAVQGSDKVSHPAEVLVEPGTRNRTLRALVEMPPLCARSLDIVAAPGDGPLVRAGGSAAVVELENGLLAVQVGSAGLLGLTDRRTGQGWAWAESGLAGRFPGGAARFAGRHNGSGAHVLQGFAELAGEVGPLSCTQVVWLTARSRVLTVDVHVDAGEGTDVGSDTQETFPNTTERRSWVEEREKLRFCLPLGEEQVELWSDHPYDVRRAPRNPYFGVSWVAAMGPTRRIGVLFDRTSAFALDQERNELSITLGYGGYFMYAPNSHSRLVGTHSYRIGIVPLGDDWLREITQAAEEFAFPLVAWLGRLREEAPSLIEVGPEAELTACFPDSGGITARLFRPYDGRARVSLRTPGGTQPANLAGVPLEGTEPLPAEGGLEVRSKEIVTLRLR